MKILILSEANSIHTIKWVKSLAKKGFQIKLFSLSALEDESLRDVANVSVVECRNKVTRNEGSFLKLLYLKNLIKLNQVIKEYKPDLVHAHYASSYGLLGALTFYKNFIVSVWGADVFSFPKKTIFHKIALKWVFQRAKNILSTSQVMAKEVKKYSDKDVIVTPFGIDLKDFSPNNNVVSVKEDIVVGTIKTLEEKYGIEYLIRAFAKVKVKHPSLPLKLLIVGDGSLRERLVDLTKELKIYNVTNFVGKVPHNEVPYYQNLLDISVSLSIYDSESFGVAIVEASACAKPVIVSNVGGLPEVVVDGITGIVVEPRNIDDTVRALESLILDKEKSLEMGRKGRQRVEQEYDWQKNVNQMADVYKTLL